MLNNHGGQLVASLRLRRSGGTIVPFVLAIDARHAEPEVREQRPDRLPAFCPNRHINDGGNFCMDFSKVDGLPVVDSVTARAWWERLWKFLSLQVTAEQLRRWPNRLQWAHGDAASHQLRAETCADALGSKYSRALASDQLRVVPRPSRPSFVALHDETRRLYSVWVKPSRVATLRQPCVCGSGLPFRSCGDHAERAAELVVALQAWQQADREFWRHFAKRQCCGSLDVCPLKITPDAANHATPTIPNACAA